MTYKTTQYVWFRWFDDDDNRIFEERKVLFEALASGPPASAAHVTLYGSGYYLEVDGTDLAVDLNGRLTSGTITLVAYFDATTNVKMVQEESDGLDVAAYLQAYLNDDPYEANPNAPGYIFDASAVPAQPGGVGIGSYGTNEGNDTIFGSQGSDELVAFGGDDQVHGNGGNDKLVGRDGNDTMWGGAGNDDLYGDNGNDLLNGEAGNDYLTGWIGKDTLVAGKGNDGIYGGAGNDMLFGGKGNDFLSGDGGKDTLDGGAGLDWAAAFVDDNDTSAVAIDLAKHIMKSVYGTDKLLGIEGAYGGNGNDTLRGDNGDNSIAGYSGKDQLFGAGGDDKIASGFGKDTVSGGSGSDQFVFFEWGIPYADRITDFAHGQDKIELVIDAFDSLSLGQLKSKNFVVGTKAKDGNDFLIYDKSKGKLYYDPDGDGAGGGGLIAAFDHKPTLTASDIKVITFNSFDDFWA